MHKNKLMEEWMDKMEGWMEERLQDHILQFTLHTLTYKNVWFCGTFTPKNWLGFKLWHSAPTGKIITFNTSRSQRERESVMK